MTLVISPVIFSKYTMICSLILDARIAVSRVSELEDFDLDGFRIKKNQTLMIFSRPLALNEEAWTAAGRQPTLPLSQFQAERFLVQKGASSGNETPRECEKETKESQELRFSLDGLAGLWLPYGGGQRMCPGRHFAKAEVLSTFALLFTHFDLELGDRVNTSAISPDLRWVPTGALPPASNVPFRIKRKTTFSGRCRK